MISTISHGLLPLSNDTDVSLDSPACPRALLSLIFFSFHPSRCDKCLYARCTTMAPMIFQRLSQPQVSIYTDVISYPKLFP